MFVRCLMVFLSVVHRRGLVRVRRKVVKFRSPLVRIFWHILLSNPSGSSAASTVFFDGVPLSTIVHRIVKEARQRGECDVFQSSEGYADSLVADSTGLSSRR